MKLPRFLLADNSQDNPDRIYVVHTQTPIFIIGFDIEDFDTNQEIKWIDNKPTDENKIKDLFNDSANFVIKELDNQEDLFDQE